MSQFTSTEELSAALARFAQHDTVIVASDFDGVLAPIVLNPMDATPLPGTISALKAIAGRPGVSVAIVSGRDLATLRQLTALTDDDGVLLIGSHGAETNKTILEHSASGDLSPDQRTALNSAQAMLEQVVQKFPAARIEQKPAGVVLHTRGLPDADAAAASDLAFTEAHELAGVHAMRGKSVVELSVTNTSKGAALTALSRMVGAKALLYLGDDVTDETVFALMNGTDDVSVKVGEGESAARYRVESPDQIAQMLRTFAQQF